MQLVPDVWDVKDDLEAELAELAHAVGVRSAHATQASPLPRPDLSVGCSIVRLRIDHMFGNRTHERLYSNIRAIPQGKGAGR